MVKINNIDKLSPYNFTQTDIINNIIIENNTTETVFVNLNNIYISNKNKIQFIGNNIVLDIKNCFLNNIMTIEDVYNLFLNYTKENIIIQNFDDILINNKQICKCYFETPENSQIGIDTSTINLNSSEYDLTTTFNLHSKLNSNRFIYLNFIGYTVTNTYWNSYFEQEPFNLQRFGNNLAIADKENVINRIIQLIWRIVAEAYSIWDVDVTTEKPSDQDLSNTLIDNNTNYIDSKYGTQCIIGELTPIPRFGGIALLGSFISAQICFVFSNALGNNVRYISSAIIHELGHTLSLDHKGTIINGETTEYYEGTEIWAPFMGVGYFSLVNQWSAGEYANANNVVDEIATISTYLNIISDDLSNQMNKETTYIKNSDKIGGIINNKDDVDTFKLILDIGNISITASVTSELPTLKVGMELYNSQYSKVSFNSINIATNQNPNMSAQISYNVSSAGIYYLKIFGVGGNGIDNSGNPTTSFNDYGSIGYYKITGTWADIETTNIDDIIVTISNKFYDGNNIAVITSITSNKLSNISIGYSIIATATFIDKNVAANKSVNINIIQITGIADSYKYILINPTNVSANISPKDLQITGTSATNKVYDGNTNVVLNTNTLNLSGLIQGDNVTILKNNVTGSFNSKQVGNNKPVNIIGFALGGTANINYNLIQPTNVSANISPKDLQITGTIATNKVYDGNTNVVLNTNASTLSGVITGDVVNLNTGNVIGTFNSKQIGNNKPVNIIGAFTLGGTHADNYNLIQPITISATISPKPLEINGTIATNKIYNRNINVVLNKSASTLSGVITGDSVKLNKTKGRGTFNSKEVGNNKPVTIIGFTIDGKDKGNYTLKQPDTITANITSKSLKIINTNVNNKIYDGNTTALLNTSASKLSGVIRGDIVTINKTNAKGTFNSKQVGNNKPVSIIDFTIDGNDTGNYILIQPTNLNGNIKKKSLTIIDTIANNKIYDGNTRAILNTSASKLSGVIGNDEITLNITNAKGTFKSKNIGNNKTVTIIGFTLDGTDKGNYTLIQPIGIKANITSNKNLNYINSRIILGIFKNIITSSSQTI